MDRSDSDEQERQLRRRGRASATRFPGTSSSSRVTSHEDRCGRATDRVSRARKSLNFDSQQSGQVPSTSFSPPFDEAASFSDNVDSRIAKDREPISLSNVSHNEDFWSNPASPPPDSSFSLFGLPFAGAFSAAHKHRRSQRLVHKSAISLKDAKINPLNSSVTSDDSGLGPTPPSSQTTSGFDLKPPSSVSSVDTISIASSDYGTLSEESFGGQSRTTRNSSKQAATHVNHLQHHLTLSPGYMSDIDEIVDSSPPSPENLLHLGPELWDEGIEPESQPSDVVLVLDESESLQGILVENSTTASGANSSSYLDISNLGGTKEVGVQWLSDSGVQIVIPLEGIQLPEKADPGSILQAKTRREYPRSTRRLRRHRLNSHAEEPFQITTKNECEILEKCFLRHGLRLIGASDTVTLHPIGTKFCALYPAVISIPLTQLPSAGDHVYCLQAKGEQEFNTDEDPCLTWTLVEGTTMTLEGGRLTFETYELCSYVVVIRELMIEAQKQIRTRIGGKLYIPEVPWIEIEFPRGALREDITAKAQVFLDTEMSVCEFLKFKKLQSNRPVGSLASPIVMLEPHGFNFLPDLVRVDLPIPNYDEIQALFGHTAKLQVWQSCTGQLEETAWEMIDVIPSLRRVKHLGNQVQTVASFKVAHFSFFKVVWDLISASLYEARVGMSYFHSFVSFSMKCQANMEEATASAMEGGSRFALEVICFRSDKKLPEQTNYCHKVGASMKPKLVRPGRIFVRLKSSYFDADEAAGEDSELVKEESDFRGRDFEVQYCCKFKADKTIDRGPFGKVIVDRQKGGKPGERLFEFNLQKSGHEGEQTPGGADDRWSIVALQELASALFILDGENWKLFAQHIGFTKQEVKKLLKTSENPFLAMVNMYQKRGGTPNEFVQGLYAVNRELKINGGASPCSSRQSRSSTGSSGRGSMTGPEKYRGGIGSVGSDSDTSGTQISRDSGLAVQSKKRSNPSVNRGSTSSKPKRSRARSPAAGDEGDEESSDSLKASGSESDEDTGSNGLPVSLGDIAKSEANASSINRRNDATKLETSFLWEISGQMETTVNWKSLGRTLWLEENILINIEVAHRLSGMRELFYQVLIQWREKYPKKCNFGTLYVALRKEGMNNVAKAMMTINRNN